MLVDRTRYCRPHKLYFKDPNVERHGGYRVIGGDKDVYDLIALNNESGIVEMFRLGANEFDPFMKKGQQDNLIWDSEDEEANDSDYIAESDYEMSDKDDEDFRKYVDDRVDSTPWCSFRQQPDTKHAEDVKGSNGSEANDSDEDYGSCDDLLSENEYEEQESERPVKKDKVFNPAIDMKNPKFELYQKFGTKWILLDALKRHGIVDRRIIDFKKNDKLFVHGKCRHCNWEVYGVKMEGENENTFQIRTVNTKHSCGRVWSTRNVNSNIISDWYVPDFADDPNITVSTLKFRVKNEHQLTISRTQAWNAKRKALEKVRGKITEQYAELESYMAEVKRSNPGTSIQVICEDDELDRLETYKEQAATYSCDYAGDGEYEGIPPKPKKMGRPPKPKKNSTFEGTSNLPKRRGRKPTAKSVCKNYNQTRHFQSICPLLERQREMVKEIEERQALNEASLNLSRTNGIEQPQLVVSECAACDSTTQTVETCPILKEITQMEEEYLRSSQNGDNGQMEEEISTPNAPLESQAGDDVDYDNTPYLIKCDYCPQFGHTKEDCPEYEGKKKAEESAEVITAALDEIINTPNAPQQSKKRPASSEPDIVILNDQSGHQVQTLRGRTVFVPAHDQATKKKKKGKQSANSGSKAEARKIQKLFCHVVPKPVNVESNMAKQLEKLKEPDGQIHCGSKKACDYIAEQTAKAVARENELYAKYGFKLPSSSSDSMFNIGSNQVKIDANLTSNLVALTNDLHAIYKDLGSTFRGERFAAKSLVKRLLSGGGVNNSFCFPPASASVKIFVRRRCRRFLLLSTYVGVGEGGRDGGLRLEEMVDFDWKRWIEIRVSGMVLDLGIRI
ncbi:OLC1v1001513C1 [Oldenlandia corymbosa var. corymbosa]|uniref:OLC1v1001513C1 n=1 Tax=Oldenlandia corymbosa var. corymbosa TaxID=529605 RepID=A0AAV1D6K4_OLDCO|nr:OLC1v1001513C1 [Oldenlandia corymbosa var. corymbosa]